MEEKSFHTTKRALIIHFFIFISFAHTCSRVPSSPCSQGPRGASSACKICFNVDVGEPDWHNKSQFETKQLIYTIEHERGHHSKNVGVRGGIRSRRERVISFQKVQFQQTHSLNC